MNGVSGVDYAGYDITGNCGTQTPYENGCVMPASASHLDCETKCNNTKSCIAYVFAPHNCSTLPGPVCWVKNGVGNPGKNTCCKSNITTHII